MPECPTEPVQSGGEMRQKSPLDPMTSMMSVLRRIIVGVLRARPVVPVTVAKSYPRTGGYRRSAGPRKLQPTSANAKGAGRRYAAPQTRCEVLTTAIRVGQYRC